MTTAVREMYARLAAEYALRPTVPDCRGGAPGDRFDGPDCGIDGCGREVGHIGDHRRDPSVADPVPDADWPSPGYLTPKPDPTGPDYRTGE